MTMYASKTPRDLNHDPEPYVSVQRLPFGKIEFVRHPEARGVYFFEPRPEFDAAQHNKPNPILVEFRRAFWNDFDGMELPEWVRQNLAVLATPKMQHRTFMTGAGTPPLCSCGWQGQQFTGRRLADHQKEARAHVDHARRVLARLARLSEGA